MSIRQRFRAAFLVVIVGLAVIATINAQAVRARSDALARARRVSQTGLVTNQVFAALVEQRGAVDAYLATGQKRYAAALVAAQGRGRRSLGDLTPLVAGRPAEQADVAAISTALTAWQTEAAAEIATVPLVPGAAGPRVRPAPDGRSADNGAYQLVNTRLLALQADTAEAAARTRAALDAAVLRVTRVLYGGLIAAAALLLSSALLIRRWVLRPLEAITSAVRDVGAGALATTIPSTGPPELARLGTDVEAMRLRMLAEADDARRASVDLARAEQQQRMLFDSIRDYSIVRLDSTGVITSWNTGAEAMTGRMAANMIGRTIDVLMPANSDERPATDVMAEVAASGTVSRQVWRERADGSRFLVSMTITAIRGIRGEVEGFAVVTRDVTAAVAAEAASLRARDELTDRAVQLQRANALLADSNERLAQSNNRLAEANRRLADANRDLVAANEELDAFSYTVSHDLRAPLRAINGFAELLLEEHAGGLDAEGRRLLSRVADNARRMGQLIDDLLSFARLRRAGLTKEPTPLQDVVLEAWHELEHAPAAAGAELRIGALPTLPADGRLMKQVFVNLLGNALKFSAAGPPEAAGGIRIEVEAGADPDGTGQPVITVRDNGIGFDPRYAPRLFQVFQRLHNDAVEGTGIGLSIVHRIVTRHGGRIVATGEPGKGATFAFTLGPDTAATVPGPREPRP